MTFTLGAMSYDKPLEDIIKAKKTVNKPKTNEVRLSSI